MNSDARLLTEKQVFEIYGLALGSLRAWRHKGGGPIHCKIGASVLYRPSDIDSFISARLRRSTSDPGGGREGVGRGDEHDGG